MDLRLEDLVTEGGALLADESNPVDAHRAHERWSDRVREWLSRNAPNQGLSAEWLSMGLSPLIREGGYHDYPEAWHGHRSLVQKQLRWLAEHGPSVEAGLSVALSDVWSILHPKVRELASTRYLNGHYADAVEAALKGLNADVKSRVATMLTMDCDGAALMTTAFSPKNPLLLLDDPSTLSGQAVQQGYMQLFAGAMTGVRNPKAHDNVTISPDRAMHFLFLASLLWSKLDEARASHQSTSGDSHGS